FKRFAIAFDQGEMTISVHKNEEKLYYTLEEAGSKTTYELEEGKVINNFLDQTLNEIRKVMPIYFIDANRLWSERKKTQVRENRMIPTVMVYARELSDWMREALAKANYYGQELDRSFPNRLMARMQCKDNCCLSESEINEALKDLEKKRKKMEQVGLYSRSRMDEMAHFEALDDQMRMVLTLYIEDSEEKIKMVESLATKINVLCNLINKRFSYKVMEISMDEGFLFRVPTNEVLKADKLSSGEQNELILMFQLLFKCPPQATILMDEPEISLHIAWQQSFLEDMETISELSQIRIMIATHSPDIINGRWDLTTGLEAKVCNPI
ncbi:MAG: AAA family ATPase, partial [Cellulosilyticum sp.]|nr:AAA family ATPase [Cellulosilyticum sp.]